MSIKQLYETKTNSMNVMQINSYAHVGVCAKYVFCDGLKHWKLGKVATRNSLIKGTITIYKFVQKSVLNFHK